MIELLIELAIRALLLGVIVWLSLRALRVKNPHLELMVWSFVLAAALIMPALTQLTTISMTITEPLVVPALVAQFDSTPPPSVEVSPQSSASSSSSDVARVSIGWHDIISVLYVVVAAAMLTKVLIGIGATWRLAQRSRQLDQPWTVGNDVRVSEEISVPVVFASTILLPPEFEGWDDATRQAVFVHELSHVQREDFYLLLAAEIHKALFWFSPLAWWLRIHLARLAEAVSDDAALAEICDRPSYAEVLINIAGRIKSVPYGVPMARPATVVHRVERILRETALAVSPSWRIRVVIMASLLPLILVAARLVFDAPEPDPTVTAVNAMTVSNGDVDVMLKQLGTVTPSQKMIVRAPVKGRLLEVSVQEGQTVKKGDILAQIDPRLYNIEVEHAQARLQRDQARLDKAIVAADQAQIDIALRNLSSTRIVAPFDGRVGLRSIDPGNYVTPEDKDGIIVLTGLMPTNVLFTVPEDEITPIKERLKTGVTPEVVAMDRADRDALATGRLVGMDNQIDTTTGTLLFKAEFDNADKKLFPGQFVDTILKLGTVHNAIAVPYQALIRDAQGTFVWVIKSDNTVTRKSVNVGMPAGDGFTIVSGLEGGDRIVTFYEGDRLQDGSKVSIGPTTSRVRPKEQGMKVID